ncbi:MAG: 4Fe-4S dicluster domain-containing protein [Armatimonadota bacterium]
MNRKLTTGRLRSARRAFQIVFLAGFVTLFALAADPLVSPVPVDLYLRADPLIALSAMVSLRRIVPVLLWYALPITLVSLLLGRVFCGWVCPMGTTIDLLERVFRIRGRRGRAAAEPDPAGPALSRRRLKFYLLIALIVTTLLPAAHRSNQELGLTQSVGLSAVYLLDPIALLTRTLTWVGLPAVQWAAGGGQDTVGGWIDSDFVRRHGSLDRGLALVQTGLDAVARPAFFRLGLLSLLLFGGVIALSRYERRFWCRNLCPLGALLGLLGKVSPLRLAVSEKCNRCMRCVSECKVGAITGDPKRYRGPECIECYTCLAVCPQRAISLTAGYDGAARDDGLQLDRRRVLGAMGAGLAAVVIPKTSLSAMRSSATANVLKLSSLRLIRPPGSLAEPAFVTACVRCGECMKVCMTNTLQPAVGEGGLEALGTPVVVPRAGACAQSCTLCGQVCPTRAIEPFTAEEKYHLYIGAAAVDRSTCIAWASGRECVICDEACSYNAISQDVSETGVLRPVVDERTCVGCGMCEWVCPVEPLGAIRVNSGGDRRHLRRAEQKLLREQAEREKAEGTPYPGGESPYGNAG